MKRISDRYFLLPHLSVSTNREQVVALFEKIKRVRDVILQHDPTAAYSKCFACVILSEAVQPYYLPTLLKSIRMVNLNDCPVIIIPMFLSNPADVNSIFDIVCRLIGVRDRVGLRQAETITSALTAIERKIKRVGTEQLIRILIDASGNDVIDLSSVERKIDEILIAKRVEKPKKQKKPKTGSKSSKLRQSHYRLTLRDRRVLKNGIPNTFEVSGRVYSREPGVISHTIFDEERVSPEQLGFCPHGVPKGKLCAICDPDEFKRMTGIE